MTGYSTKYISGVVTGQVTLSVRGAIRISEAIPGIDASELLIHENLYRVWLHRQSPDPTRVVIRRKAANKRAEKARSADIEVERAEG